MHVRHASPAPRDPPAGPADDHPITPALRLRTCQIISARFRLENERHARMAIEIKGLKLQAMTARGHLDRMTKAYAKFNEAAPAHAADVEGMAEQVTEMQSDLEFATNLLGNSPAVSGNGALDAQKSPKEPAGEKQVIRDDEVGKLTVAPPVVRLEPYQGGIADQRHLPPEGIADQRGAAVEVSGTFPRGYRNGEPDL